MLDLKEFLEDLINNALAEIEGTGTSVYTFAFYHDHESRTLSVCIDTKENSDKLVLQSNEWSNKHFLDYLNEGDLDSLKLFQINSGRNFSLGDFTHVNLARTKIPTKIEIDNSFYISVIKILQGRAADIKLRSNTPKEVIFCTSTEDDEVGLQWK